MKTLSPLTLLCALGVLTMVTGPATAAADTSQWKCETCPFEKTGVSGTVDAGVANVSDRSATFGDFTGLNRKGAYLTGGADARYQGEGGLFGSVVADSAVGSAKAVLGQEGLYTLRFGYSNIPHRLSDDGMTPFLGVGSSSLTLPAGFRAATTTAMPLATSLQSVDVGSTRTRYDAAVSFNTGSNWTHKLSFRRDVRDGTQVLGGSFFATAAQLLAPVDTTTDQFEISTQFSSRKMQASLAYQVSQFRNDNPSLTWANPFSEGGTGASRGQLALAPDNQFHQLLASGAYEILPWIRASGDVAVGRMTQDAAFLAPTLNPGLALLVPALPETSLHGKVDTFNGSARVTMSPTDRIRVNASYARDVRDNKTDSFAFPAVSTDLFLGTVPRSNQAFTFKQDRYKLNGDYRGPAGLKASAGVEENDIQRSLQDTVNTREATAWGRVGMQLKPNLSVSLKLSHAERSNSGYGSATWVTPAENPYMRKFNLADRRRDTASVRADMAVSETLSIGVNVDAANDKYSNTTIGLTDGRSLSYGADMSMAISEETSVTAFAQAERLKSNQAGSSVATLPDWFARNKDAIDVVGIGLKHSALKGKLELGADLSYTRSHSDMSIDAGPAAPAFPTSTTARDSIKLYATYQLEKNLSLTGGLWYEDYRSHNWKLEGVLPATVTNLLTLGDQPPQYHVYVVRLGVRYRF